MAQGRRQRLHPGNADGVGSQVQQSQRGEAAEGRRQRLRSSSANPVGRQLKLRQRRQAPEGLRRANGTDVSFTHDVCSWRLQLQLVALALHQRLCARSSQLARVQLERSKLREVAQSRREGLHRRAAKVAAPHGQRRQRGEGRKRRRERGGAGGAKPTVGANAADMERDTLQPCEQAERQRERRGAGVPDAAVPHFKRCQRRQAAQRRRERRRGYSCRRGQGSPGRAGPGSQA